MGLRASLPPRGPGCLGQHRPVALGASRPVGFPGWQSGSSRNSRSIQAHQLRASYIKAELFRAIIKKLKSPAHGTPPRAGAGWRQLSLPVLGGTWGGRTVPFGSNAALGDGESREKAL